MIRTNSISTHSAKWHACIRLTRDFVLLFLKQSLKQTIVLQWFVLLEYETLKSDLWLQCAFTLSWPKQNAASRSMLQYFMTQWWTSCDYGLVRMNASADIVLFHCLYSISDKTLQIDIFSYWWFELRLLWKCIWNFTLNYDCFFKSICLIGLFWWIFTWNRSNQTIINWWLCFIVDCDGDWNFTIVHLGRFWIRCFKFLREMFWFF